MTGQLGVRPLRHVGAEITGLDCGQPLSNEIRRELYQLYLEHGILLFRGHELSVAELAAFSRVFGELEIHPLAGIRLEGVPELIELTNREMAVLPGQEDELVRGVGWHSDLVYTPTPSRGAVLCARIIPPEGGDTGFIDTAAAYDALSEEMKARIENLECVFSQEQVMKKWSLDNPSYAKNGVTSDFLPPAVHRLVWVHPESGRKALNVSPIMAAHVLGVTSEESADLLATLTNHAVQDRFSYIHKWRMGDLVAWDNWRTMHRVFDHKRKYLRVLHRSTIKASRTLGRLAA